MTKGGGAIIDPDQSANLRDRLLADIGNIPSAELAASWARQALPAKNKLAVVDAKRVEDAFEQRLSELAPAGISLSQNDAPAVGESDAQEASRTATTGADQPAGIDKSVVTVATPRRYRNREHLRFVAKQPA